MGFLMAIAIMALLSVVTTETKPNIAAANSHEDWADKETQEEFDQFEKLIIQLNKEVGVEQKIAQEANGTLSNFMKDLELQATLDEKRKLEYVYVPSIRDSRFVVDRYGSEYLQCKKFFHVHGTMKPTHSVNEKCHRTALDILPSCSIRILATPSNPRHFYIHAGCATVPAEKDMQSTSCTLLKSTPKWPTDNTKTATLYSCSCTSQMCNGNMINTLNAQIEKTDETSTELLSEVLQDLQQILPLSN